jgi:hypothetical protein
MIGVRLVLGIVLGTLLAVGGYFVGWYIAFSVPEGYPRIPFLVIPAGIGGGLGSFLGWWLDLDGGYDRNKLLALTALTIAIMAAVGGAWGGYSYGESIEGTRVWRQPTTQAILNGTVIASNIALLVWYIGVKLLRRPSENRQAAPKSTYADQAILLSRRSRTEPRSSNQSGGR